MTGQQLKPLSDVKEAPSPESGIGTGLEFGTADKGTKVPSETIEELQKQKLQIEIRKLQQDFGIIRYSPIVQSIASLLSPTVGAIIAIIILMYYQKPQNEQLALTRLSEENAKMVAHLTTALSTNDKKARVDTLIRLQEWYPNQPIFKTAVQVAEKDLAAFNEEEQRKRAQGESAGRFVQDECKSLFEAINKIKEEIRVAKSEPVVEISGRSPTGEKYKLQRNYRLDELNKSLQESESKRLKMKC